MTKEALVRAASAYAEGQMALAFHLYSASAKSGHIESQVFVGWMLCEGVGCEKDEKKAEELFSEAAKLGSSNAHFYLGKLLVKNLRHVEAFSTFLRGADLGNINCLFHVGYSLARGRGVEINHRAAYEPLSAAARRGHTHAMREVAILDLKGHRGAAFKVFGVFEMMAVSIWAFGLYLFRKNSELLKG